MLTVVPGDGSGHEAGKDGSSSLIDEIVREGARRMLAEALQAEEMRKESVTVTPPGSVIVTGRPSAS